MTIRVGRGVVYLTSADSRDSRVLGVEIRPEGISFRRLDADGSSPQSLFQAAGALGAGLKGSGSILFDVWPAAPRDEFSIVAFTVKQLGNGSEDFSIRVTGTATFGATAHTQFSNLDVTFRHVTGQPVSVDPSSKVTLNLLGTSVPLGAAVDAARGLVFTASGGQSIAIDDIGTLNVRGTAAASPIDRWRGVLASYFFGEGAGSKAHDNSGSGLILTATALPGGGNPNRPVTPRWVAGGIEFDGTYYLRSSAAAKLVQSIRRTRAFSVEVWIQARQATQDGPAPILSLQANNNKSWFTLAQGAAGSANDWLNIDIQFDNPPRAWASAFASPAGSLPDGLAHVVYTRDADGLERIFVNARQVAERVYPGSFAQWADDFTLLIGSDKANDPETAPWAGQLLHLSIYDQALSLETIVAHAVPNFSIEGAAFVLRRVPAPLSGVEIPTTVAVANSQTTLTGDASVDLAIKPNLALVSLATQLSKTNDAAWTFTGAFGVRIWRGVAELQAAISPTTKLLQLTTRADQGSSFEIPGLGSISFGGIDLSVTGSGDNLGWSLGSQHYLPFTALPASLPPNVAVDGDFKLMRPLLGIDATDVLLVGDWLAKPLVVHTRVSDGAYRFEAQTQLSIDFALDLPAPVHAHSGAQIGGDVHLVDAKLDAAVDMKIDSRGFFATLDRNIDHADVDDKRHNLKLAQRRLYATPAATLQRLAEVTASELSERIESLFAANRRKLEVDALEPAIPLALLGLRSDKTLPARFLEQDLTLTAAQNGADWRFTGDLTFSIPFSLDLPPLFDDSTGAQLTDAVHIVDQAMNISMSIVLTPAGFLATLRANFDYTDASGTTQSIVVPERRLYAAPQSKNELLGDILREVAASGANLFSRQGRNVADYYLTLGAKQPRILLSSTGAAAAKIETTLPRLFGSDKQLRSANGIFELAQIGNATTLSLNLGDRDGAGLRADYDDLLTKLAAAAPLGAGAVKLLARRIAERMPADYDAILYYYYGWDVGAGRIDLEGGMRLRVDVQNYQFVQVSDPSAKRGFVGSGSFHIPIRSYTYPQSDGSRAQLLGFGPFASQLQANSDTDITFQGAGGVFDLIKAGNRRPFYRMFFPKQPSTGLGPERTLTILGADTLAELQAATSELDTGGDSLPTRGNTFFFRGKAFIVPEIVVFVAGAPVHVPVGTTLRQLIESSDHVPAAALPGQDLRGFMGRSRPLRLVHEGPDSKAEYRFINAPTGDAINNMDILDLPLVKGDRFDI